MTFVVCRRCKGYYELEGWESVLDFEACQCGGELIAVESIDDYLEYIQDSDTDDKWFQSSEVDNKPFIGKYKLLLGTLGVVLALVVISGIVGSDLPFGNFFSGSNHSLIGSDYKGYVSKETYSRFSIIGAKKVKIAIVTGMHPRENLSKTVARDVIKNYDLPTNYEIICYDITVLDNPDNFNIGRANGEELAARYILPDIVKSKVDLIIICHDHEPGYGNGFYIATPKMDEASVNLAMAVNKAFPELNFYPSTYYKGSGTSTMKVSKPLASAGYKTFVYEIPEWINYNKAYNMTYTFIKTCFTCLSSDTIFNS